MSFAPVVGLEKAGREIFRAKHGDDSNLYAEFHVKKQTLPIETEAKGEIVTRDIVYIRIYSPGDKTKVVERKARISGEWYGNESPDNERFAAQYARFKAGQKQLADGTSIDELGLGDSEVKAFNSYNILTCEHLIGVPDGLINDLPIGTRAIIEIAKKHLAKKHLAKNETESLKAENVDLKARLEALEAKFTNPESTPAEPREIKRRHRSVVKTTNKKDIPNGNSN